MIEYKGHDGERVVTRRYKDFSARGSYPLAEVRRFLDEAAEGLEAPDIELTVCDYYFDATVETIRVEVWGRPLPEPEPEAPPFTGAEYLLAGLRASVEAAKARRLAAESRQS